MSFLWAFWAGSKSPEPFQIDRGFSPKVNFIRVLSHHLQLDVLGLAVLVLRHVVAVAIVVAVDEALREPEGSELEPELGRRNEE